MAGSGRTQPWLMAFGPRTNRATRCHHHYGSQSTVHLNPSPPLRSISYWRTQYITYIVKAKEFQEYSACCTRIPRGVQRCVVTQADSVPAVHSFSGDLRNCFYTFFTISVQRGDMYRGARRQEMRAKIRLCFPLLQSMLEVASHAFREQVP